MKTTLPQRSLLIREKIETIVAEARAVAKDKIAMIILFGSYARGDWVIDEYIEGHITYCSDIDIMLVMKKAKHTGMQGDKIVEDIKKRVERKYPLPEFPHLMKEPWATFIVEDINKVNKKLGEGHYFFCDIKKEGILLYDSREFELSEAVDARQLPWSKQKELAKEDYEEWFLSGSEFLSGVSDYYMKKNSFKKCAFLLHQATESFYSAILLVFRGYKKKLHDIETLGGMARSHHRSLLEIFPRNTVEQAECFKLLKEAYIKARYDKNYKITAEQLLYLIERVEKLKIVTEQICIEWINREVI